MHSVGVLKAEKWKAKLYHEITVKLYILATVWGECVLWGVLYCLLKSTEKECPGLR